MYDGSIEALLKRIELLEAAVFAEPAGPLPESRFEEPKQVKKRELKKEKIQEYVKNNNISKTELVILCQMIGKKCSSVLPKEDIVNLIISENEVTYRNITILDGLK